MIDAFIGNSIVETSIYKLIEILIQHYLTLSEILIHYLTLSEILIQHYLTLSEILIQHYLTLSEIPIKPLLARTYLFVSTYQWFGEVRGPQYSPCYSAVLRDMYCIATNGSVRDAV